MKNKVYIILKNIPLIIFLLLQVFVKAQKNIQADIHNSLTEFAEVNFKEKVFLHIDKTFYVPGEVIWLKAYVTDGYLNKPSDLSKVVYAEVLDKDNKPVLQAKISIENGTGSGSFDISTSVLSGTYKIRAYTNWMKNFDAKNYFEESITILNPFRKINTFHKNPDSLLINFFPEGGNLVYGIQSKVAVLVTDIYGKGQQYKGLILNTNNDTITQLNSQKSGMGSFSFTPQRNEQYKAVLIDKDESYVSYPIPNIFQNGYVLSVKEKSDSEIYVSVKSTFLSNNVNLFVISRQIVKTALHKRLANGEAEFIINKHDLGEGVSRFILFTDNSNPVCERLYFQPPSNNLLIDLKTNSLHYKRREKIILDLETTTSGDTNDEADLSIAVFRLDSLQALPEMNIKNYLWLSSDLNGTVESPEYYFTENNDIVKSDADLLMLTYGWTRFKWEDTIRKVWPYLPEYEGHLITGKIIDAKTGIPGNGIRVYISAPGRSFLLNSNKSDDEGNILFNCKKIFNSSELITMPVNEKDSNYRIAINSPFSDKYTISKTVPFFFNENNLNQLEKRSINAQTKILYKPELMNRYYYPLKTDTSSFYGVADNTYLLDNYTRFITMEEVFKEFVNEVRARKEGNSYRLRVKDLTFNNFFDNDPLILLNGLPVYNASTVMNFDPLKIQKIEVVAKKQIRWGVTYDGIINCITYFGETGDLHLNPSQVIVNYEALQMKREFYAPIYETEQDRESRLPDFRDLLYWNPSIKSNKKKQQIGIFSSDQSGVYAIIVQGISNTGACGYKSILLNVD